MLTTKRLGEERRLALGQERLRPRREGTAADEDDAIAQQREARALSEPVPEIDAVEVGHHHVAEDDVEAGPRLRDEVERRASSVDRDDVVIELDELAERAQHLWIVVDEQDARARQGGAE